MALFDFGKKKKLEKLKQCLEVKNYEEAIIIADQIPIRQVKNVSELNMLGKAYKKHEDFFLAREFFERSYKQRRSRIILMDLMDCCLALKDLEAIEHYFNEYQKLAPEDKVTQYKYRYEIEKIKGRERKLLITILEELKVLEYVEEYAYELAFQYHKVGRKKACINECKDIISWFGFGKSVERAKRLLAYYRGEISLEELEPQDAYYTKKPIVQEKKQEESKKELKREQTEDEVWIANKAEKIREEVRKIEETASFQEEVKKAEEASRIRKEARRVEELKGIQEAEKLEETIRVQEEVSSTQEENIEVIENEIVKNEELVKDGMLDVVVEVKTEQIEHVTKEFSPSDFFVLESEKVDIPKEKYKELFDLLEEKKISLEEILQSFSRVDHVNQQVLKCMDMSLKTKENSFFAVMGEEKSGKTTLALKMIKLLFKLEWIKYDRTAIIDAEQLNQIAIREYRSQLRNCNIIVERAGSMTEKTINELVDFMREQPKETCLFLEDTLIEMKKIISSEKEWSVLFYNQVLLQEYTLQELMGFAYDYITKEDYSIDDVAAKVLWEKINEIVKFHRKESSLSYVMQLIKATLQHAEARRNNTLLEMVTQGKIQKEDQLVIIPEDILENVIL